MLDDCPRSLHRRPQEYRESVQGHEERSVAILAYLLECRVGVNAAGAADDVALEQPEPQVHWHDQG